MTRTLLGAFLVSLILPGCGGDSIATSGAQATAPAVVPPAPVSVATPAITVTPTPVTILPAPVVVKDPASGKPKHDHKRKHHEK